VRSRDKIQPNFGYNSCIQVFSNEYDIQRVTFCPAGARFNNGRNEGGEEQKN
jgi:hypothetical protein